MLDGTDSCSHIGPDLGSNSGGYNLTAGRVLFLVTTPFERVFTRGSEGT
jgi:hypothetical protein